MATTGQWAAARIKYETTGLSAAKIAAEIGVSGAAISKHSAKGEWVKYSANAVKVKGVKVNAEVKGEVNAPDVVNVNQTVNQTINGNKPFTIHHPDYQAELGKIKAEKEASSKRPIGRPPFPFTQELAQTILSRLESGEGLKKICQAPGMPDAATVRGWALDDREGFYLPYTRSRQVGFENMAEEIIEISDRDPGSTDNGGTDSGAVQWQRLRVDTRKWLLAKVLPKIYGDNKHVEVSGTLKHDGNKEELIAELRTLFAKGVRVPLLTDVTDVKVKE